MQTNSFLYEITFGHITRWLGEDFAEAHFFQRRPVSKAKCISICLDTWGHVSKVDFVNKDISLICKAMINWYSIYSQIHRWNPIEWACVHRECACSHCFIYIAMKKLMDDIQFIGRLMKSNWRRACTESVLGSRRQLAASSSSWSSTSESGSDPLLPNVEPSLFCRILTPLLTFAYWPTPSTWRDKDEAVETFLNSSGGPAARRSY